MTLRDSNACPFFSRRAFLKSLGVAPLVLRPAPFFGSLSPSGPDNSRSDPQSDFSFADLRLIPHYPVQSPLADVLRRVAPGSDEYITEKYALEIESILQHWGHDLTRAPLDHRALAALLDASLQATPLAIVRQSKTRSSFGIEIERREFAKDLVAGRDRFLEGIRAWLGPVSRIKTAEFEIYGIEQLADSPARVRVDIRYDLVAKRNDQSTEERVGSWRIEWSCVSPQAWRAQKWEAAEETVSVIRGPAFIDVSAQALGKTESYQKQMLHGADYWRTVLDGAVGADVYCNNGVAVGDFDNDGFDDLYVCQQAGLPNRLYRNQRDGTFEDVTEKAGVGVLDGTACALFADFRNNGLQDLLVVCDTGPLLFQNQGNGTFTPKRDAFRFARQPQGTFTHATVADYDRDGRLDIYFCTYMYYLGLDQYHYPIPYYDARNGPPNCLFHNEGNLNFVETTESAGMNADNNRYSFACAWGDSNSKGLQDLFVANDFGSSQLYRNNGNGTFTVASSQAHVEDVGAGMSCCWCDFDNDGRQDVYVPSMWEAAGQRVSEQARFHAAAPERIRRLYQRHARGNALYRNQGDGTFQNIGHQAAVEMGRWSWCSDFWDFDQDGYSDLYVTNGYISGAEREELASFFWRQVVAQSPEDATHALAYERGWNAINELIRSDKSWHGYARNVMFANNHDGTFSEISGPSGLDFVEDGRSFALADIDHDGRLEVILKNRNAPQLRVLRNAMTGIGRSISFRLKGQTSNRDAIGASITVETGALKQTKYLQAGSGFLAQHSKELFFGLGDPSGSIHATIRWPNGSTQQFAELPADQCIEISEGAASFSATAFKPVPAAYLESAKQPAIEPLPPQVETWLIEPLKAPSFSLPDASGKIRALEDFRGSPALLNFWSSASPQSLEVLSRFEDSKSLLAASRIAILAVNVDTEQSAEAARSFASQKQFSFPTLVATKNVSGIYNIVYSHLFDRHRDLPIPSTFLLDPDGMIVKVYQGPTNLRQFLQDVRSIPSTAGDRLLKAIPFKGLLAQDAFQRNVFTFGVAFYQNGYLEQATETFQQVIAAKPTDADAYYNLGTLNLRKKDYEQARQYLEQTVKLRPDYPEAWNNLGMIAAHAGDADEAVNDFQRSLSLRPDYAIALVNLGNLYRTLRTFDKAEDCLRRAFQLEPGDPEVNYSLGMLYAQQGQSQSALEYLQKALAIRPDYPEALNNLGVLFVRGQEYAKAEDQFKTGIRVAPNFDQSYLNLARLYVMRNNHEQARKVLHDLLQVQPENAAAKQALEMLE
jgi:tetratricopeptide (TPR) repeat protein